MFWKLKKINGISIITDGKSYDFHVRHKSNWGNPYDEKGEEAALKFEQWLKGEIDTDLMQGRRYWLIKNKHLLKDKKILWDCKHFGEVLARLVSEDIEAPEKPEEPDARLPETIRKWHLEHKTKKKKKEDPKLKFEVQHLF